MNLLISYMTWFLTTCLCNVIIRVIVFGRIVINIARNFTDPINYKCCSLSKKVRLDILNDEEEVTKSLMSLYQLAKRGVH